MLSSWWGKILLGILIVIYMFGLVAAHNGTFLPPLGKSGKYVRSGSRHYIGGRGYHGYRRGGGIGYGK